jgi:hypothetical protein
MQGCVSARMKITKPGVDLFALLEYCAVVHFTNGVIAFSFISPLYVWPLMCRGMEGIEGGYISICLTSAPLCFLSRY